jgi:hypothetical protein
MCGPPTSGCPVDIDSPIVTNGHGDLVEIFWRFCETLAEIFNAGYNERWEFEMEGDP